MAPLGSRRGVDFFKREVRGLLENGSNETYKLSPSMDALHLLRISFIVYIV